MAIQRFYNKTIYVSRQATVSGYKKNFVGTGTFDTYIRELTEEESAVQLGIQDATHKAYIDVADDIKKGDKIRDNKGITYYVVSVLEKGIGIAMNEHKELILREHTD